MLRSRSKDPRIFGQVPLRQRDHHAPRTGFGDRETNVVTDRDSVADPLVLDEALMFRRGRDNDVRPEAPDLEPSLGIEVT